MNLTNVREKYAKSSGKASDIARQLSFAGLALVWVFKIERGGNLQLPGILVLPAGLFVLSLALDLLQYIYASAIWGFYGRLLEGMSTAKQDDVDFPFWFNWPALAFFWLKLTFVMLGYFILLQYIQSIFP